MFPNQESQQKGKPFISPNERDMIHFFDGDEDEVMDDEVKPESEDEDPANDEPV